MKHTPGPWKVMNQSGVYAATPFTPGQFSLVCEARINGKADAHLIAAAPEMLEALEQVQRMIGGWRGTANDPLLLQLNTVIAKARGES